MIDNSRGWEGLPEFSRVMYQERYFLPGEGYNGWLNRVVDAYADEQDKEIIKDAIQNYWFHPATPVASNASRPDRGLPVSCFVQEVEDSKEGIFEAWQEQNWLGALGGGVGSLYSNVRSTNEAVGSAGGKSSGIIPFLKVADSMTMAVSQGSLRRASQAIYLDVSHPEIMEFVELRKATGDRDRRCLNLHHAVVISDAFMDAVHSGKPWELVSPKTGEVVETVDAFDLFKHIIVQRMETGEPYVMFKDNANRQRPAEYVKADLEVKTSQLCSEVFLNTEPDKTAVCVLSSLNLEYYDEYKDNRRFFLAVHRFMDNVLQSFIDTAQHLEGFGKAVHGATTDRPLGIGVMGYHSYLQKQSLPMQALATGYLTDAIFRNIKKKFDWSNRLLADERGPSPLAESVGVHKRNTTVTAIAPTASISNLMGVTSPGIDPRVANIYTAKTNIGTFTIKNKFLEAALEELGMNTPEVWKQISKDTGSCQGIDIPEDIKEVFKTAHEINQGAIISNVSKMQKYIDQGISTNIFVLGDADVEYLFNIHVSAWKSGLKSLYYVRSAPARRAGSDDGSRQEIALEADTCLGCA